MRDVLEIISFCNNIFFMELETGLNKKEGSLLDRRIDGELKKVSAEELVTGKYIESLKPLPGDLVDVADSLSKNENQDFKMSPGSSGWRTYWAEKIVSEKLGDENVQEIAKIVLGGEKLSGDTKATFTLFVQAQLEALGYKNMRHQRLENVISIVGDKIDKEENAENLKILTRDFEDLTEGTPFKLSYWSKKIMDPENVSFYGLQEDINKLDKSERDSAITRAIYFYINKLKLKYEKIDVMDELKRRMSDIDKGLDYGKSERIGRIDVFYDEENKELFTVNGGERNIVKESDFVADQIWGIKYCPDINMPRAVWRRLRKLSDIEEAKRDLDSAMNRFFMEESGRRKGIALPPSLETIERTFSEESRVEKETTSGIVGFVAERMLLSFLTRVSFDQDVVSFEASSATVYEDHKFKYDLKVFFKDFARGLGVDGGEKMPRKEIERLKKIFTVGLQLTVGKNSVFRKGEGVEAIADSMRAGESPFAQKYMSFLRRPVDDVVLVSLPAEVFKRCYGRWLNENKKPGGPEQYLTLDEKIEIVREMTKNLFTLSVKDIASMFV